MEEVSFKDFMASVEEEEKRAFSIHKTEIISNDPTCKTDLKKATRHAAGLQILRKKLDSPNIHMAHSFNSEKNAYVIYFNDKKIASSNDSLIIWRANTSAINTIENAKSILDVLSLILTVLGYEVYADSDTPFNPIIQGKAIKNDSTI